MSKTITIKLTKTGPNSGPFTITDAYGNVIASGVTLEQVSTGISYIVDDDVNLITITSEGKCAYQKSFAVTTITQDQ